MVEINFACKRMALEDILKCSFGLNNTEVKILVLLTNQKNPLSSLQISKILGKDKTTIQRSVKKLNEKNLLNRHQINLKKGGYVFVYSSVPKNYLKNKIFEIFERFKNNLATEIDRW